MRCFHRSEQNLCIETQEKVVFQEGHCFMEFNESQNYYIHKLPDNFLIDSFLQSLMKNQYAEG